MSPVISEDNSEHYLSGAICDGWHLAKTSAFCVISESVPAGCGEVRHFHQRSERFFYVMDGEASIELDGECHVIGSRQAIHIPADAVHQLKNNHSVELKFLVVSTPPSHGDRVVIENTD